MHPALSLFRRILRLHRQKLPSTKRKLGDSYVKKEFRDHRTAKPEFVRGFLGEWTSYAEDLEKLGDVGKDLRPDVLRALSEEQKAMLTKLRHETKGLK